ncbi:MAG: phosphate ABC transporter permease PstA [Chloroflexi bacterium]|nr:phosphate ABC transporter permease PstA [Chloroflexota bacterium]
MAIGRKRSEAIAKALLWGAALLTLAVLIFILIYILQRGLPVLSPGFLLDSPEQMGREGGIFPTIVGTVFLTAVAIAIATPLGIGTAVFLTEYTREGRATRLIRFGTESLSGVPSIIFGLFGFAFFVIFLGLGWSILSGGLTLAAMVLPTIIRTAEEAIRAVPPSYRQVSFALGASRWQTVTRVVLPSALPGIITGVILAIGRSVGETAAVILTAGSSLRVPTSLFSPARTMSVHFYILAREGISLEMAYGTGALLIISVLLVNLAANWLMNRLVLRAEQ